jgi:preprotein translocase subunit SecY
LFENGSVMVLDKIAEKSAKRLSKHGIKTLLYVKMITASEISAIMAAKIQSVRKYINGLVLKGITGKPRQHPRSHPQGPQRK